MTDMGTITTIGVISDTHGLLRPSPLEALQGSQLILHAGDIGGPEILARLRTIAPVTAGWAIRIAASGAKTCPMLR